VANVTLNVTLGPRTGSFSGHTTVRFSRWHREFPDFFRTIITGRANVTLNVTFPGHRPEPDLHTATIPGSVGGTRHHRIALRVTLLSTASRLATVNRVSGIQWPLSSARRSAQLTN
jgi:hypothetical protein